MAVLTAANRIRHGTQGVRRVYAGATKVWEYPAYLTPTVGTVSTPDAAQDPAGGVRYSANPTDAVTYTRVVGASRIVGANAAGTPYPGQIRVHQLEAINRAQLVFPGTPDSYLEGPVIDLTGVNQIEFVIRAFVNWDGTLAAAQQFMGRRSQSTQGLLWRRTTTARVLAAVWNDGANQTAQSDPYPAGFGSQFVWFRCRIMTTTVTFDYSTAQSPIEPTTWTNFSNKARPGVAMAGANNTLPIYIADTPLASFPFNGRIARAIMRNITAGTTLLDVSENNAGTMTDATHFTATSGQPVTVFGATVVQPQADSLVWRFDAAEYPGGASYVDPRGRTWTVPAGAIGVP